ncbi:aldo/keto reductase [Ktedonosporobacter rubrisoli]|uniref:Aldo/keto reductase n=1 Tax=Ktedonosporobacter rubrisoli TaxID=2509675 RepID=A0A4V0YZ82_KTERU|nr:aldo/keto reductase [Ktedonosporobacter rubrisoli]QBD78811.1 aldo/keto reductase [Ktedonosporobacter rubrisoli]
MAIATQQFGRSGHMSTRVIFGAAALSDVTQDEADRTLDVLLKYGINHIDVAASYGDAELRLAPWLAKLRAKFFLATKTGARTAQAAKEELHRSLERLGVDYIDLWQLHNLADPIEWDEALSPGGALDAAIEAKQQGLIRAIGITGHGSQIAATHRRSLQRFDFDSVLLPYNYITMQNPYYAENFEALLATCQERKVAVQTIKSIAYRHWMGREQTYSTWYSPLEEQADIDRAVHWVLSRPGIFLLTAGDTRLLPRILEAASRFASGPTDDEMQAMVTRLNIEPLFV